jgi:shikimate dehydrogenase
LLGAGSAAKAIALSLAQEVEELYVLNRTPEKVKELKETIDQDLVKKVTIDTLSPKTIKNYLQRADILVNATSAGMRPNADQTLVPQEWLKPHLTVMDIVYSPVETKLIKEAKAVGARVISGVEMLIFQGAASFEIWTGHKAPVEIMKKAALKKIRSGEKT